MAVAFFDRVYEIAPVYRAEKHATSRLSTSISVLIFEMGYIDSMYDVMKMEIAMLRTIFGVYQGKLSERAENT